MGDHALDIELGYFDQNREEWCEQYIGQFALIKGAKVDDFYNTENDAYAAGCELWGMVPFLIKEVQLIDKVVSMPTPFIVKMKDEYKDR